jgi:dTDP-4-dehydrorhamnose reductase
MRHVVIIGANGQLGTDLVAACDGRFRVTRLTHADLDVCDETRRRDLLGHLRPDVLINTSAFHKVDVCEDEPQPSFAVNATAAYGLACVARDLGAVLIHFSTDYVFDGRARSPYTERDRPNPLNVYGISKLAGEHLVRNFCPRHFVIRTTGLYGVAGSSGKGGNFVETMVRLGKSGNPVRVVHDQVLTPTATADLAAAVVALVEHDGEAPYGLYHVTSAGQCSWYEFAKAIFELCGLRVDLSPITTAESGSRAVRPAFSVLDHGQWVRAGLRELRPWPQALRDYLSAKGHISGAAAGAAC